MREYEVTLKETKEFGYRILASNLTILTTDAGVDVLHFLDDANTRVAIFKFADVEVVRSIELEKMEKPHDT